MSADEMLALLRDQRRSDPEERTSPVMSLPLRIQPARASALGWSPDLFALTVLVGNASLRAEDGALLPRGHGPVVALCAEYDRPLISLGPPALAPYSLARARLQGIPALRLPGGWLRAPLRLETTHRTARAAARREDALARAGRFLVELEEAWRRRLGAVLEIAWPVYGPEHGGALLDGVAGAPLPELSLR
ncbi:MAG TPA: hypothetical protein VE755_02805 [Myxococcales bacterium]|nr:hypothetical protein [Myxococcales bacterium]